MKKLVNSKVIDIDNIELFEMAAEGMVLQSQTVSNTSDGIDQDMNSPAIQRYIKLYDIFFKSMPYPLYAIESDIKYATLANFIKSCLKDEAQIWVENGIYIKIDLNTGLTLHLVNNTWSLTYVKEFKDDNTDMELFKDFEGYKEYTWVLDKVIKRETTANFYKEFMPKFVEACNNEAMIINWELKNILTFCNVPNKIELKPNTIINPSDDCEYSLDIFCSGTVETGEKAVSWNFTGDGNISNTTNKTIRTYDFDSYSKKLTAGAKSSDKMTKCEVTGLRNLFTQLCAIKAAKDMSKFPEFEGIIFDGYIIFTINKRLYIAKNNKLMTPIDVAHGVSIYGVDGGKVYFVKSKQINNAISKDTMYSYTLKNENIKMCKIFFTY